MKNLPSTQFICKQSSQSVTRSPNSECCVQVFPRPGEAWSFSRSIVIKIFFEIPGRADTIRGKNEILKLARPDSIEVGKITGGNLEMVSQGVANRVPH